VNARASSELTREAQLTFTHWITTAGVVVSLLSLAVSLYSSRKNSRSAAAADRSAAAAEQSAAAVTKQTALAAASEMRSRQEEQTQLVLFYSALWRITNDIHGARLTFQRATGSQTITSIISGDNWQKFERAAEAVHKAPFALQIHTQLASIGAFNTSLNASPDTLPTVRSNFLTTEGILLFHLGSGLGKPFPDLEETVTRMVPTVEPLAE